MRSQFESKEYLGELLFSAGEAIEQGDFQVCEKKLSAAREYFSKNKISISNVLPCLAEKPIIPEDKEGVADLLISTIALWVEYDERARRVVAYVISQIWKKYHTDPYIAILLENSFESIEAIKRSRLLRDPDLRNISQRLSTPRKYEWMIIPLSFLPAEDTEILKWFSLSENRLRQNPFRILNANDLHSICLPPNYWNELQSSKLMHFTSKSKSDRELLIRFLEVDIQDNGNNIYDAFPVYLMLDLADLSGAFTFQNILQRVVDAIAIAWVRLISKNPGALLNLSRSEQYSIAEFLTWKAGSTALLQLWLREHGLKDTFAGNMVFRRIKELPDNVIPETITHEKIYEWIAQKPPDLSQTYILVDLRSDVNEKIDVKSVETVLSVARFLSITKAFFKVFSAPPEDFVSNDNRVPIVWDTNILEKIINSSSPVHRREVLDLKFSNLFWPQDYPYATTKIAKLAKGSLSNALYLGNTVINKHVYRSPQNPYLDKSDLQGIE